MNPAFYDTGAPIDVYNFLTNCGHFLNIRNTFRFSQYKLPNTHNIENIIKVINI